MAVPCIGLHYPTDNGIEETGATSLSEALKSNTTLTELDLSGEDKRHTKDIHQQFICLHSQHVKRKQD